MVDTDRGDDGDGSVDDVGGVPAPAETDLDDGDVDGASANAANAIAVTTSNLLSRGPAPQDSSFGLLVDQLHERFDLAGTSPRTAPG